MTIGMKLPPNSIDGKRVAASKPQALGLNDEMLLAMMGPGLQTGKL